MDESDHSEAKSKVAQDKPRDAHGHFVHEVLQKPANSRSNSEQVAADPDSHIINKIFPTHLEVDHKVTNDDLLDVHLGNPLRKITALLEEIKKQKAFSFTLKGSLGIAGVVLALSVFGFFGGTKILCDKGTQTLSGTIKSLRVTNDPPQIPLLSTFINSFNYLVFHKDWPVGSRRYILVDIRDASTNVIQASESELLPFVNKVVYVTGSYDSCSRMMKASLPHSIEEFH